MKRVFAFLLIFALTIPLCACGEKNNFVGTWHCYKLEADGDTILFSDLQQIVSLDYSVSFFEDKTYIMHYYVDGEEGSAYPQSGTYALKGNDQATLTPDGIASIMDGEVVLYIGGGKTYFKKDR